MDDAATEQLSAYLDGELTDTEVAELEHRLARDPELRSELELLRGAVDLLRTHGPVQAPNALYGDVLRALESEPMPGGFWSWLRRPLGMPLQGLAVAAVAVLVIAVAIGGSGALDGTATTKANKDEAAVGQSVRTRNDAGEPGGTAGDAQPEPVPGGVQTTATAPVEPSPGFGEPSKDVSKELSQTVSLDPSGDVDAAKAEEQGTADDPKAKPADVSKLDVYGGGNRHTIALRPEDLPAVAQLVQRYRALSPNGADPADAIAGLDQGEHSLSLRLPDGAARNAFEAELRRAFKGRHSEKMGSGDTLTLDGARVDLMLVVRSIAPSGTDSGTLRALKSKKDSYESPDATRTEQAAPASDGR